MRAALRRYLCLAPILPLLGGTAQAAGTEVRVAAAANLAGVLKAFGAELERREGVTLKVSLGSTGKLFAQIRAGAPFDLFLSADPERPDALAKEGLVSPEGAVPYAIGRLALWSPEPGRVDGEGRILKEVRFKRLAIAAPAAAPYGAAAIEVLRKLGIEDAARPKLVMGENIAQAWQFVESGNADLGLLAYSQVISPPAKPGEPAKAPPGSLWLIPAAYHSPILQKMATLKPGSGRREVRKVFDFIRGAGGREILAAHGYDLPPAPVGTSGAEPSGNPVR